jgi:hypothetical protein
VSEPASRRTGRSVAAIAAGFFVTAALSLGMDVVLHATRVFPPWGEPMSEGLFGLATAYRVVFTLFGGWLVARLAPDRPMRHAWILGAIGTVVAAAGVAASWSAGPELGPRWYPVALAVTGLPCVVAGAWVRVESLTARRAPP